MNDVLIQTVVDVFQIKGRGTVVTGIAGAGWRLAKRGDKIELRTPNGRRLMTAIKDLEVFAKGKLTPEPIPSCGVLLADAFAFDQLPKGTEMLLSDAP